MSSCQSHIPLCNGDTKRFNTAFNFVAYGLLVLIIIFSTYLHHRQPQVLRVPSNSDGSSFEACSNLQAWNILYSYPRDGNDHDENRFDYVE